MLEVALLVTVFVGLLPSKHLVESLAGILGHSLPDITSCLLHGFLYSLRGLLDGFFSIFCGVFFCECDGAPAAGPHCKHSNRIIIVLLFAPRLAQIVTRH